MSLVDYQSSSDDESGNEEICSEEKEKICETPVVTAKIKKPVKIAIPSISEFEEEVDGASPAKKTKLQKSSGLISMLPPPKFSGLGGKLTLLVPHVLKKQADENKKRESVEKKTLSSMTVRRVTHPVIEKSPYLPKEKIANMSMEDTNEEASPSSDYFSLETKPDYSDVDVSSIPLPVECSKDEFSQMNNLQSTIDISKSVDNVATMDSSCEMQTETEIPQYVHSESVFPYYMPTTDPVVESDPSTGIEGKDFVNDEGFLRLQGKRRGIENVNIIDISGDSLLADKTDWHVKSLTEEKKITHSRKKGDMPSHVQKRKHQITYLAYQAKERELDLKNQWSHNRLTKQQTQAKYGF